MKWHGGTGSSNCPHAIANYKWAIEHDYWPICYKKWDEVALLAGEYCMEDGDTKCVNRLKTLLEELKDGAEETKIYLHGGGSQGIDRGVSHYGVATGEVIASSLEYAKEMKEYGVRQDVITTLMPDGWKNLEAGPVPPYLLIKVRRWTKLTLTCKGAGLRPSLYSEKESEKVSMYSDS